MATPVKGLRTPEGTHDLREVRSVRDWIELLKSEGEYHEVHAKVDWNVELGTIARHVQSAEGPALLFDNIKDHENTWCTKLFTNSVGSYGKMSLAFGLPKDIDHYNRVQAMRQAYQKSIPPKEVSTAPLKRNVLKGDDIDLNKIPVPKWHHWDGGRYINTLPPSSPRIPTRVSTIWASTVAWWPTRITSPVCSFLRKGGEIITPSFKPRRSP